MKPQAISLFSGAGGCSLGFKQAGYDIAYASDIDKSAVDTYKANFPNTECKKQDINDVDFDKILEKHHIKKGELDVVIGGPPCQGFSTAGLGFWEDPRNQLLKSYVRALSAIQPKWFVMENVEGLLTSKKGMYIFEAAKAFIELGYQIRIDKIYTQEYGVPQRRKRVIIIGNRLGLDFDIPTPLYNVAGKIFRNSEITLRDAIGSLPQATKNKEKIFYNSRMSVLAEYLKNNSRYVTEHFYPKLNELQLKRIEHLAEGQTMKDIPEELQHESFKRRANRRVKDGTPSEKRGGSPSGLKRLVYDEPSLTITGAATREFIHPKENRPLTLREAARIQTFPDDFVFTGNDSQKIKQIGNAIPPVFARTLAKHICDCGFDLGNKIHGELLGYSLTKASAMSPALKRTDELLSSLTSTYSYQQKLFG